MSSQPLQTRLKLLFGARGIDVTKDITPDLLSFQYADKESNEADELNIVLKDETGKWAKSWSPDGGERIKASITQGTIAKKGATLNCGTFFVDKLSTSGGSGRTLTISAVSIPLNKPIRREKKSKAWENFSLQEIAQKIADTAGLKLLWDVEKSVEYDRQDQSTESDLTFLSRLCSEAGLSLKITDEQLVIFDQLSYEKKSPIKTLNIDGGAVISWSFEKSQSETYKSVTVSYRDPSKPLYNSDLEKVSKGLNTYTAKDEEADENAQEYTLKKRAKSLNEAKRIAENKLRELNRRSIVGTMKVIGDVEIIAGVVVRIVGVGSFDGNFIVESASHDYGTSGYTTDLTLRRVNNRY